MKMWRRRRKDWSSETVPYLVFPVWIWFCSQMSHACCKIYPLQNFTKLSCHLRSQKPQVALSPPPATTYCLRRQFSVLILFSDPLPTPQLIPLEGTLPFLSLGQIFQMCTIFSVLRTLSTLPIHVHFFPWVMEIQNYLPLLGLISIHLVPHILHPSHWWVLLVTLHSCACMFHHPS